MSGGATHETEATPLDVRCKVCDKPYRNEAPLLVWVDGKGMQPPEPSEDWWLPNCRHKNPPQPHIATPRVSR